MSSFWINVKKILPYKNLEVKDLAFRANVPYSTIINGMNKNSMPLADLALKISKILNISLESLLENNALTIDSSATNKKSELQDSEINLYRKNKILIDSLEKLPEQVKLSLEELIIRMAESY